MRVSVVCVVVVDVVGQAARIEESFGFGVVVGCPEGAFYAVGFFACAAGKKCSFTIGRPAKIGGVHILAVEIGEQNGAIAVVVAAQDFGNEAATRFDFAFRIFGFFCFEVQGRIKESVMLFAACKIRIFGIDIFAQTADDNAIIGDTR